MRFSPCHFLLLLSVPLAGAESWNVRIEPSLDGEIVATAAADASAPVREKTGDWHGIDLPENAPVWVASVFLNSDGSLKESARLRSGPGVIYPAYHYSRPEVPENVKILERAYDGAWLRIAPLRGLRGYVHSRFFRESAAPSAPTASAAPVKPDEKIRRDNYLMTVEGIPVRLSEPVGSASYELILEINGKKLPIGYLLSPRLNLNLWENRMVRITGRQLWVKGIRRPFWEIEKVSPSWK